MTLNGYFDTLDKEALGRALTNNTSVGWGASHTVQQWLNNEWLALVIAKV